MADEKERCTQVYQVLRFAMTLRRTNTVAVLLHTHMMHAAMYDIRRNMILLYLIHR